MKKLKAGLFGLGVVGSGVYKALTHNAKYNISIEKIAVKDISKNRGFEILPSLLTTNADEILDNAELDIVIELINDPEEAFEIVRKAFENGKSVVSANKKMVALYHREILDLQKQYKVKFFYEGAVCGSVPILRILDQHFQSDEVKSIKAIANGTCNFILSKMVGEGQDYEVALKEAQNLGFAEIDPYSDVSGEDTRSKLSIMIFHAFGAFVHPHEIPLQGINSLDKHIIQFAQSHKLKIKLVGEARLEGGRITAKVEPQVIDHSHEFYTVENEFNGILVDAEYTGEQFFKGKGAGSNPTALAVLTNLEDIKYNLSSVKNFTREFINFSEKSKDETYFVSGFNKGDIIRELGTLEEDDAFVLTKGSFSQFYKLKRQHPNLYWVQVPEKICQEIVKHEVLV